MPSAWWLVTIDGPPLWMSIPVDFWPLKALTSESSPSRPHAERELALSGLGSFASLHYTHREEGTQ